MKLNIHIYFLFIMAYFCCLGCKQTEKNDATPPHVITSNIIHKSSIPLPAYMMPAELDVIDMQTLNMNYTVYLTLTGRLTPFYVYQIYKTNLEENGWQVHSGNQQSDNYSLYAEKNAEPLSISITKTDSLVNVNLRYREMD